MSKLVENALMHWKSTASSLLTIGLVVTGALLTNPQLLSPRHAVWLLTIQAIAKGWIGLIQQDSGKTLAEVPGQDKPQVVPSHENAGRSGSNSGLGDPMSSGELKTFAPHQQRVLDECDQLQDKLEKLTKFTESDMFDQLDLGERFRLRTQLSVMELYVSILLERINNFV